MDYVTFEQVFWYTNACPLRKVREPVLKEESERCKEVRSLVHTSLLNMMAGRLNARSALVYLANITSPSSSSGEDLVGPSGRTMTVSNLSHAAVWAADSWHRYRGVKPDDFVEIEKEFITYGMKAYVDLARFKRTHKKTYLNLTWVRYNMDAPTKKERGRLFQWVQYNGRAYHLATGAMPTQLDIYYPFLNYTFHFLYNPETSYEEVAALILKDVYYAIPSPICNVCNMCPMEWDIEGMPKSKVT